MFLQMELTTVEQTLNTKPSLGVVVPCPNLWSLPVRGLRVNELEEQLKDQEAQAEHNMEEEGRRHREAFSKMERDKNTHLELLNSR